MRSRAILRAVLAVLAVLALNGTPALSQPVTVLSLKEAEAQAVQNHPQIRAGQYAALAAGESVREARAAYFPSMFGSVTGVRAQDGTRIAAGGLNNPTILDRFAYGFSASQMLTDFGRTPALTASAALRMDSQQQDVAARRAAVLQGVDRAYFDALRARTVLRVAEQTVSTRQVVLDQVTALAAAGLKSSLDVSFARVNLSEAQLLLLQSQNDVQAAYAGLSAAMGSSQITTYELSDEPLPDSPATDSASLVAQALRNRPDIARERLTLQADSRFADAERALFFPTVSLVGAAGLVPFHQIGLNSPYSAIGVNVTIPLTNGQSFAARRAEANFRASAEQQTVRDLENRVTRDVQVAWLDARTAFQRLDLTGQLLSQANDALDLAQERYSLGLSSIVELTQAQLNQTRAQIEQAAARYEYQWRSAALRFQVGSLN